MLYDILNIDYQKGMERRMVFQRIRDMREDADLKQNDMAKILHCSQQAYSNYELGQRDIPTDILIATIEAMRDLKAYYENDACALARINGKQASELAQARLESAEVATGLYGFYGAL